VSFPEQAVLASLMAGLATGLGAIPVLLGGRLGHRWFDGIVGFAAGAMLAISGNEIGSAADGGRLSTLAAAGAGGMAVLAIRALPSIAGPPGLRRLARGHRVALMVTLHNLVEGLMVVATYARSGPTVGLGVAVAIAAHNVPEGLAVAEPLRRAGLSARRSVTVATLSGLAEPVGAVLGLVVLGPVLPAATGGALAAGAMVVLAAIELIPEAFSHSYAAEASVGLLGGIVVAFGLLGGLA
jgi:zinc transporter, ZIP family